MRQCYFSNKNNLRLCSGLVGHQVDLFSQTKFCIYIYKILNLSLCHKERLLLINSQYLKGMEKILFLKSLETHTSGHYGFNMFMSFF